MKTCQKCGCDYQGDICPNCGYNSEDIQKSEGVLYGPPPIDLERDFKPQPLLYGPPPIDIERGEDFKPQPPLYGPAPIDIDRGIAPKPQPVIYGPPPAKRFSCSMILLAVGFLLAVLIAWLIAG